MPDYYPVISKAVSGLHQSNPEARRQLYEHARAILRDQLHKQRPQPSDREVAREEAAFDEAVLRVELELSATRSKPIHLPNNTNNTLRSSVFGHRLLRADEPGGRIERAKDKTTITLFENADNLTVVKLLSHQWLDELVRYASPPNAPPSLKEDLTIVMRWLGIKRLEDLNEVHHKRWAVAFQEYLIEGRAPSAFLGSAFQYFRRVGLQRSSEPSVSINDDIRGVMDRMLATDTEISEMRKSSQMRSPLDDVIAQPTAPVAPRFQGVVFFVIAFLLVFTLEILLLLGIQTLSGNRVIPRGIGWLVLPVLGGIAGWIFGSEFGFDSILRIVNRKLDSLRTAFRIWFVGSALWILAVLAVFIVFDPFGRYRWDGEEWLKFLFILVGMPMFGLFSTYLFEWALKNKR